MGFDTGGPLHRRRCGSGCGGRGAHKPESGPRGARVSGRVGDFIRKLTVARIIPLHIRAVQLNISAVVDAPAVSSQVLLPHDEWEFLGNDHAACGAYLACRALRCLEWLHGVDGCRRTGDGKGFEVSERTKGKKGAS